MDSESSTRACILLYINETASGKLLCNAGSPTWRPVTPERCGMELGGGKEVQEGGGRVSTHG